MKLNPFKKEEPGLTFEMPQTIEADHQHQWETYAKTYAVPRKGVEGSNLPEATIEKALFGVTTFILKCVICQVLTKEEMLGSDEVQLNDMVQKINQYGPQYFQEDNVTYVVQRYVPAPKSVMDLPMRPA